MKLNKYLIVVILLLCFGGALLHQLISSYQELEENKLKDKLHKTHSDAIISAKAGFDVYAAIVSSIKSHIKNSPTFPNESELQNYLNDLLNEIKFNDSIVVSYNDKDHVFKYVITQKSIDPANIKGLSARELMSTHGLKEFEELMKSDSINLMTPINVKEGWVGFPFSFKVENKQETTNGYLTSILNVKYLLNYFYEGDKESEFVHKFIVKDSFDLTREVIYNETPIYNKHVDAEYYKNFNIPEDEFIYSNINVFGLDLKIGSAFKNKPDTSNMVVFFGYLWYILISLAIVIISHQYFGIKDLNIKLRGANADLEKSLVKIETLIKEIHHRIKNNMQMISGVLSLQQEESESKEVHSALDESISRIHSMALVHEQLYNSASLKEIKTKEYSEQLLEFVEKTIGVRNFNVKKIINIDKELIFDADTTANLGLILNELITNSYKFAFKKDKDNSLEISIFKESDHYTLEYSDSGSGLPDDFNFEESESLGVHLILILAEQLHGEMTYSNKGKNVFKVHFKPLEASFS
ncbi:sensor histidine kinase [Oceanihabitans sediminis]|uniref:sensor histidine kinase n=1 Tax=Oceanihabitans sediminis TaxID=1812012 RepID=UPI0009314E63|nr:sensor histidine kinase [Oceanihabitans sediminis]MDX1773423.1 sensor histidine kinase [Oceanihabitans sediminis]